VPDALVALGRGHDPRAAGRFRAPTASLSGCRSSRGRHRMGAGARPREGLSAAGTRLTAGLTVARGRWGSMSASTDGSGVHTGRFFSDNVRLSGMRGELLHGALDRSGCEPSVEPLDGTRTSCHVSNGAVSPSPPLSAASPRGCAWNFSSENFLRALLPVRRFGEPDGEPSRALGPGNRETRPPHPPGRSRHHPHRGLRTASPSTCGTRSGWRPRTKAEASRCTTTHHDAPRKPPRGEAALPHRGAIDPTCVRTCGAPPGRHETRPGGAPLQPRAAAQNGAPRPAPPRTPGGELGARGEVNRVGGTRDVTRTDEEGVNGEQV
jgi:hypothetical protein